MDEYKAPYLVLWRGVDAALWLLDHEKGQAARETLLRAQQDAETAYMEAISPQK